MTYNNKFGHRYCWETQSDIEELAIRKFDLLCFHCNVWQSLCLSFMMQDLDVCQLGQGSKRHVGEWPQGSA